MGKSVEGEEEAEALVAAPAAAAPAPAAVPAHDPTAAKAGLPHASPTIRRLARELGVPVLDEDGLRALLESPTSL